MGKPGLGVRPPTGGEISKKNVQVRSLVTRSGEPGSGTIVAMSPGLFRFLFHALTALVRPTSFIRVFVAQPFPVIHREIRRPRDENDS